MKPYSLTYFDSFGVERNFSIEAKDENDAINSSPIPEHQITDVSFDVLGYFGFILHRKNKIQLQKQSLYLHSIASVVDSGLPYRQAFEDIFLNNSEFNYDPLIFKNCEKLSDFISKINFHPSVLSISSVADTTGKVVNSLEMAAEFCDSLALSEEQFMSSLFKSLIYIIIALFFLVAAPFIEGNMLYEMVYVDKSPLPLNFASHLLIESVDFYKTYGLLIIALVIFMIINRRVLFEKVKHLMFFRLIHKLIYVNRSFVFISVYKMMLFSGVTPISILQQMYDQAKGRDRPIYKKMIDSLGHGSSIGETIDQSEWVDEVFYTLNDSDKKTSASLEKTFNAAKKSIMTKQKDVGRDIGKVSLWAGMLSIGFVIIIIFIGFFIPIYAQKISF